MAMKRLLLVWTLVLSGTGLAAEVAPALAGWDHNHPKAAAALADVVRNNPEAARRMFLWDHDHPLRSQAFVAWTTEHPEQGLDDFIAAHRDWPVIDLVIQPFRATFEAFISWARAHPEAARDLASEPKGLAWVGFHFFGDLLPRADRAVLPAAPPEAPEPPGLPEAPPPPAFDR
jgi:hypothetical protein